MNDNAPLTPPTAPDALPALATATPWDAGASTEASAQPMEHSPWDIAGARHGLSRNPCGQSLRRTLGCQCRSA